MQIEIISVIDGYIIKENVTGGKFTKTFKKTLSDVADHIDPRHPRTVASQYDIAHDIHLQEVASKAKPEIQASDFLKAEAAKAQSYKCTAPPYPSNQANLGQMNINAANAYCGGIQYSMANLAQQQGTGSIADIDKWLTKANAARIAGFVGEPVKQFDPAKINADQAERTANAIRLLLQDGIACRIYKHGSNWVIIPDGKASSCQDNLQDDGK